MTTGHSLLVTKGKVQQITATEAEELLKEPHFVESIKCDAGSFAVTCGESGWVLLPDRCTFYDARQMLAVGEIIALDPERFVSNFREESRCASIVNCVGGWHCFCVLIALIATLVLRIADPSLLVVMPSMVVFGFVGAFLRFRRQFGFVQLAQYAAFSVAGTCWVWSVVQILGGIP